MNFIKKNEIDFEKLDLDTSIGCFKNKLFFDKDRKKIYKFFSNLSCDQRDLVMYKLIHLQSLRKDYLSKVEDIIFDDNVVGYTQRVIEGNTLSKEISKKGLLKEIKTILELSKNLEDLHKNNIIVSDLHFNNVMVDENNRPIFIDQDSFKVGNIDSFGVSILLNNYCAQKGKPIEKNENTDRIALYLSLFDKIFGKEIYCVSRDSYSSHLSNCSILKELYPLYIELSNRGSRIPEVPYLHKVLNNYDKS